MGALLCLTYTTFLVLNYILRQINNLKFEQAVYCPMLFNPIALRMAKTLWSFGHSECNKVKERTAPEGVNSFPSVMTAIEEDKCENSNVAAHESVSTCPEVIIICIAEFSSHYTEEDG